MGSISKIFLDRTINDIYGREDGKEGKGETRMNMRKKGKKAKAGLKKKERTRKNRTMMAP